ncbi:hypothetical protein RSAG8_03692, partial [Rhizoctonia solani AG-8 WAC10335]
MRQLFTRFRVALEGFALGHELNCNLRLAISLVTEWSASSINSPASCDSSCSDSNRKSLVSLHRMQMRNVGDYSRIRINWSESCRV